MELALNCCEAGTIRESCNQIYSSVCAAPALGSCPFSEWHNHRVILLLRTVIFQKNTDQPFEILAFLALGSRRRMIRI